MWNALSRTLTRSLAYKIRCRWFDSAQDRCLQLPPIKWNDEVENSNPISR